MYKFYRVVTSLGTSHARRSSRLMYFLAYRQCVRFSQGWCIPLNHDVEADVKFYESVLCLSLEKVP